MVDEMLTMLSSRYVSSSCRSSSVRFCFPVFLDIKEVSAYCLWNTKHFLFETLRSNLAGGFRFDDSDDCGSDGDDEDR